MAIQDASCTTGTLADLSGSGAESCDFAGRLQKVQVSA
jgi:hypothetical protein